MSDPFQGTSEDNIGILCDGIFVAGSRAATLFGTWNAVFYIEGQIAFQTPFTISSTAPPPGGGPPAGSGSPPKITFVDIPGTLVFDAPTDWNLGFADPDGDINWILFENLTATGWTSSGGWNPATENGIAGMTSGSLGITTRCSTLGKRTVRVTLFDEAGNSSKPWEYTFDCVSNSGGSNPPPPSGSGDNPWDTTLGQNCFEQWIDVAMSALNGYDGSSSFNGNKPYSINKYGVLEGRNFHSVRAPDDFGPVYHNNKYWFMWDFWNTWNPVSGWPNDAWDAAGVPSLRGFVNDCIDAGGAPSGPTEFARALDDDGNAQLSDSEVLSAIQYWISGDALPDVNQLIDDQMMLALIRLWITGESLNLAGAPQTLMPQAFSVHGLRITSQGALQQTVHVMGSQVVASEIQVFDLQGRPVTEQQVGASSIRLTLRSLNGKPLANGTYMFVVTVYGARGEVWRSGVQKLIVLR